MGSAVGAVKRANRLIPSAWSIASAATATATAVAAGTLPVGRVWIGEGIGSAMVMAGIPVVTATAAGRAATTDRTTGIVGYVLGDRAIGSMVTDGCSPGTAAGAGDRGIIRTAEVAGDGRMVRTGCHTTVGAGGGGMACTTVGVGDSSMARTTAGAGDDGLAGADCHTAVGAGNIWPVSTAVGSGDVWMAGVHHSS
jgi:hypothetical protein